MNSLRAFALTVLLIATGFAARAETGDEPDGGQSASSSQAEPVPSAEDPASAAEAEKEATDAMVERVTRGYKVAKRGDTDYYCRVQVPTGSRLGKRHCYTLEQLVEAEHTRQQQQQRLDQIQTQRPFKRE